MSGIHVFDTYAKSTAGRIMHFDVVLPENDQPKAVESARLWLKSMGEENAVVNPQSCCHCHSEPTASPDMLDEIQARGFAIFRLEGCPKG
ncbi:DUF2024 family protein [Methylomagnum sp.]